MMSTVSVQLFLIAYSLAASLAKEECTSSGDCPQTKVCAANLCEDPCASFCGNHTVCEVKWHTPICRCHQGYHGDPIQGCTESAIQECSYNGDCPLDKACEQHSCEDPCLDLCGNNTVCQIKRHIPVCRCLQGFIGNPMVGCTDSGTTGKKRYYVERLFKLNWFAAELECKLKGMMLATVKSQEDTDNLVTEIKKKFAAGSEVHVWLGASDLAMEGHWYWTSGKRVDGYINWGGPGYPSNSNGGENCLEHTLWPGGSVWNDNTCTKELTFACEFYE